MNVSTRRLAVAAVGSALPAYYLSSSEATRAKLLQTVDASRRVVNLVSTAGLMVCDYSYHIYWSPARSSKQLDEYSVLNEALKKYQHDQEVFTIASWKAGKEDSSGRQAAQWQAKIVETRRLIDETSEALALLQSSPLAACHQRGAERLRDMCAANRGVYIKLGQHLAMLDHILPREYNETLLTLLADTPRTPYAAVRRVIKEDLGAYPEDIFSSFSESPIASASLAQVHVATLRGSGRKVAVKVQHEGLREGSVGDMYVITVLVDLISRVFEGFSYTWLSREMNSNLPQELDFKNELGNLQKAARTLKGLIDAGDLVIPQAHRELSSKRVLTMDFEAGCYATDVAEMQRLGIKTADVARLISRVFCEQIYRFGWCHCDPHEGNMLVRLQPGSTSKPQIVLLDHGLYRQLGQTFRKDYCRLWRALVLGDEKEIKLRCENLHVGQAYTLLAAVLTMRPWDDIVSAGEDLGRLKTKNTKGESEMLKAYAKRYFKDIVGMLGRVDSEMLLLLKTNDCLRHLDKRLGAPINTAVVVADITSDVVFREELQELRLLHLRDYAKLLSSLYSWLRMRSRLWALRLYALYLDLTGAVRLG